MKSISLNSSLTVLSAGIAAAALIGTVVSMNTSMSADKTKTEATASVLRQCGISFDKNSLKELSASLNPSAHALNALKVLDLGGMKDEVCKPVAALNQSLTDSKTDSVIYANKAYMARAVLASIITYSMQDVMLKKTQVAAIVDAFDIHPSVVAKWSSTNTMKSNLTQYGFKSMENNAAEADASLADLKATVGSPEIQKFIASGPSFNP